MGRLRVRSCLLLAAFGAIASAAFSQGTSRGNGVDGVDAKAQSVYSVGDFNAYHPQSVNGVEDFNVYPSQSVNGVGDLNANHPLSVNGLGDFNAESSEENNTQTPSVAQSNSVSDSSSYQSTYNLNTPTPDPNVALYGIYTKCLFRMDINCVQRRLASFIEILGSPQTYRLSPWLLLVRTTRKSTNNTHSSESSHFTEKKDLMSPYDEAVERFFDEHLLRLELPAWARDVWTRDDGARTAKGYVDLYLGGEAEGRGKKGGGKGKGCMMMVCMMMASKKMMLLMLLFLLIKFKSMMGAMMMAGGWMMASGWMKGGGGGGGGWAEDWPSSGGGGGGGWDRTYNRIPYKKPTYTR